MEKVIASTAFIKHIVKKFYKKKTCAYELNKLVVQVKLSVNIP